MAKKVVPAVPNQKGVKVLYAHRSKMGWRLTLGNEYIVHEHYLEGSTLFGQEWFVIRDENGKESFVEEGCFIYNKIYR